MIESREWYDYIDTLVIRHQQGNNECSMELLDAFGPYMLKFSKIMQEGFINLKDRDSRKFISLFISDLSTRKKLVKAYQSAEVKSVAHKAANMLAQTCMCMTPEDIDQELKAVFFTLVMRWKKSSKKANFCGYLYNSFRYELKRSIEMTIKNPLAFKLCNNIRFNDEEYLTENLDIPDTCLDDLLILVTEDDLDNSWIRGLTCSDAFCELTQLQRLIVVEYYEHGLSDQKIANKVGMHINTINRNRIKATKILKGYYGVKEN